MDISCTPLSRVKSQASDGNKRKHLIKYMREREKGKGEQRSRPNLEHVHGLCTFGCKIIENQLFFHVPYSLITHSTAVLTAVETFR